MVPDLAKAAAVFGVSAGLLLGLGVFVARGDARPPETLNRKIEFLRHVVSTARPAALARFWAERKAAGGPMVEAVAPGRTRVTFLYRGDASSAAVRLESPVAAQMLAAIGEDTQQAGQLQRVAGTDIWWIAVDVRDTGRIPYDFAVVKRPGEPALRQSDPLNPERFVAGCERGAARSATRAAVGTTPQHGYAEIA